MDLHSDYGPEGQEKDANQDYVLAWAARDAGAGTVAWMVALADGVSSSYEAQWGAELACWAALAALRTSAEPNPRARARSALDAATTALEELAAPLQADPQASRPPGEFAATWNYTLRQGLLFQTTLTLLWSEGLRVYLAGVGDGGACHWSPRAGCRWLCRSDPTTQRVHCLGPHDGRTEPDLWAELQLAPGDRLALFSDGVDRGIGGTGDDLAEWISGCPASANRAQRFIEQCKATAPEAFFDNLTLALVERE